MTNQTTADDSQPNAYFVQDGDVYAPTEYARGTWDPRIMHGRYVSAILAHAMEAAHGSPDFQVSRISVDLFRTPYRQPVRLETRLVRDGNRIRVADASIFLEADGSELARGSMVMLRRTEQPDGEIWAPEIEPMPDPAVLEGEPGEYAAHRIPGAVRGRDRDRAWYRAKRPLVLGVPLTPVVRVALTADLANVSANGGSEGLNYINADVVVHMVRDPEGEWVGLDTIAHHAAEGIAVGECLIHDRSGPLGRVSMCSLSNRHRT